MDDSKLVGIDSLTEFEFDGTRVAVDGKTTGELYDGRHELDWCPCHDCTNARITRRRYTPPAQVEWLRRFGVDPWKPVLRHAADAWSGDPPHFTRSVSCWFVAGRIISGGKSGDLKVAKGHTMRVDESFSAVKAWGSDVPALLEELGDHFCVISSNTVPWVHGEVCQLRSEKTDEDCSICERLWRESGYLRRRSLIPEWEGAEEVKPILRDGKQRVLVEYCSNCGNLEYRIVPRQRPFRRKGMRTATLWDSD